VANSIAEWLASTTAALPDETHRTLVALVGLQYSTMSIDSLWKVFLEQRGYTSFKHMYESLGVPPEFQNPHKVIAWLDEAAGGSFYPVLDERTGALTSAATFTRASTATYFDAAGVMQTAAVNTPRYDYDPATLAYRGLLMEDSRTNLMLRSQEFDNATWLAQGTKEIVANTHVAPDGMVTADTLSDTNAGAFNGMRQGFVVANDTASHTLSIYVKKTSGGTSPTFGINFAYSGGTGVTKLVRLNTDTGVEMLGTAGSAVYDAGSYWRLCITNTNNATGNTTLTATIYPATNTHGLSTDSMAATGSAVIWGAQLEAAAFATSYIPTAGTTVTRSGDDCTASLALNDAGGTLFAEFAFAAGTSADSPNARAIVYVDNGATNNRHQLYNISGNLGGVTQVGVTEGTSSVVGAIATGVLTRAAYAYAANDFRSAVGGTLGSADTSGAVPTGLARCFVGMNASRVGANAHLRRIRYYSRRLSNSELQAITA
jgi:hypothetical protein